MDKVVLRYNGTRALMAPAIFVALLLISFISRKAAFTLIPFILLSGWAVRRYFLRKHADKIKAHL